MDKLYENIKKIRKEKHMSQERLAELVGYTDRSSIAKIENGLVDLPQSKIVDIAKALNTTPGELMGETIIVDYKNMEVSQSDKRKREQLRRLLRYYLLLNNAKVESLTKYAEFLSKEDDYDD